MQKRDENDNLIIACKAGDVQAMEKLIKNHSQGVHSLIYSILGDRDLVEDFSQETFLRAFVAIKDYKFKAPFRSWLYRIAVNLCRDHFRRTKVRQIVSHFKSDEGFSEERILVDAVSNPLTDLEQKESASRIHAAIQELPPHLRSVLVLRDVQDMTYNEISKTLNWRLGTVKTRLFRARRQLAEILRPYWEDCK